MSTIKFGAPIEYTNDFSNIVNDNVLATRSYVSTTIVEVQTTGTSGWATNANNSYLLNNNNSAFYLNRANHTGTQVAATISDFSAAVTSLLPVNNGVNTAKYQAKTNNQSATDPTSGYVKWNNATQTSASQIYIDIVTNEGVDITAFLVKVATNSILWIQKENNSAQYQRWQITNITNNSGWFTFDVTFLDGLGSDFSNNNSIILAMQTSGAYWKVAGTTTLTDNVIIDGATYDFGLNAKSVSFGAISGNVESSFYFTPIANAMGFAITNDITTGNASMTATAVTIPSISLHADDGDVFSANMAFAADGLTFTSTGADGTVTFLLSSDNGVVFTDNRATTVGIEYAADYSAQFSGRSLVNKNYVTSAITNGSAGWATNTSFAYTTNDTASNGLTKTGNNFTLGGTITQNTAISGTAGLALTISPATLKFTNLSATTDDFIINQTLIATDGTLLTRRAPFVAGTNRSAYSQPIKGPGTATVTNGSNNVTGSGTNFLDTTFNGMDFWFIIWLFDGTNWWKGTQITINTSTQMFVKEWYSQTDMTNGFTTISGVNSYPGVSGTYSYYMVQNFTDFYSNALGNNNIANNYSTVLGGHSVASGGNALVVGYYSQATNTRSIAMGAFVLSSGAGAFAGGLGVGTAGTAGGPGFDKRIISSGNRSFSWSENTATQTTGHGALGNNSVILGGLNHNIPSDSPRSVILGGTTIKARAATADMVYVPSLNIATSPIAGTSGVNLDLLARYNSGATGDVAKLTLNSSNFAVAAGTISVSTTANTITDFNATVISLIPSGTAGFANNAALLNSQNGTFYQTRSNHVGTQTISTISDLVNGTAGYALVAGTALNVSFTASNGLTKTGSNIALGGSLTNATTLTIGDNDLTISAASTQGYGLKYAADYSAYYNSRSLVDKAYVDTHFSAGNTARSIGFSTDGNGQVISTGIKGYIVAGFTGTITGWDVVADKVGTIIVDVWKATGSVPTIANTITGSQKPTLSSTQFNSSTDVSTWITSVTLGDIIVFNVTGATLITKVTVTIRMIQ